MLGGFKPWISMWTSPRPTIRAVVNLNPKFGVIYLAAIYALENNFFFSSYWSLGLSFPFYAILLASIVLAPVFGIIWVYFTGWILHFTGKWLNGTAPMSHLRAAAAWSKIPSTISILMWLILLITNSEMTFIHAISGPTWLFMNLIAIILGVWSLVLLVQSIQEVQAFSLGIAFLNVVLTWIISSIICFVCFLLLRYIYIAV